MTSASPTIRDEILAEIAQISADLKKPELSDLVRRFLRQDRKDLSGLLAALERSHTRKSPLTDKGGDSDTSGT